MKKLAGTPMFCLTFFATAFLTVFSTAYSTETRAEDVFRIELGKDYHQYNTPDLQRRVWELERAVFQLQQKVFQLEINRPVVVAQPVADSWVCTIESMGNSFTGTGPSKALAKDKVVRACKEGNPDSGGFFCKNPICEQ